MYPYGYMDGWMNIYIYRMMDILKDGWIDKWIYGWMYLWMNVWIYRLMNGLIEWRMELRVDVWKQGWIDGYMEIWMDGWIYRFIGCWIAGWVLISNIFYDINLKLFLNFILVKLSQISL